MDYVSDSDSFTQPSFSLKNRVARAVWGVVWTLMFKPSPRWAHAWRAMLLRLFGAKLGGNCRIYAKVEIWAPWNLVCGDTVGIGDKAIIYNQAPISLGDRAVISQGAHLCTGTHDYRTPEMPLIAKSISIGSLAWIAAESFVHPGVKIGEGAVIGARSVVTKDMPPWMICCGHPCVPVKARVLTKEL